MEYTRNKNNRTFYKDLKKALDFYLPKKHTDEEVDAYIQKVGLMPATDLVLVYLRAQLKRFVNFEYIK